MPLELQDVDFADGPAVQNVYISAFFDDRMNQTLFPGMSFDQLLAGAISRWPRINGGLERKVYKKVVDTTSNEVIGYSIWGFQNTTAGEKLAKPIGLPEGFVPERPVTPEGLDDPSAVEFTDKCAAVKKRVVGDRPAIILRMLGTLPSHRCRGAGGLHLAWANEVADREGLVCFTEASPVALPLYESFGYKRVENGDIVSRVIDGGTYTYAVVIREPQNK
ncbi:hypothetical protein BKA67DRAFT_91604 [Truncatella angustata]|uniref:N-acetyltransferase domain-containing protein n=1 Tax=Truncatella angustata TaxID=152316 RepID=A0A9P8RHB0_9PEZI|nr:uncharacterized protein BKA67DRAFT_91604 [Truncatella angustata]KAH6646014.1 hypothetical protein BKA67DRAFT_91604 [Truncatella angustata]